MMCVAAPEGEALDKAGREKRAPQHGAGGRLKQVAEQVPSLPRRRRHVRRVAICYPAAVHALGADRLDPHRRQLAAGARARLPRRPACHLQGGSLWSRIV